MSKILMLCDTLGVFTVQDEDDIPSWSEVQSYFCVPVSRFAMQATVA